MLLRSVLKKKVVRLWTFLSSSGEGPTVSSCEHRNEPFSSVKCKGLF